LKSHNFSRVGAGAIDAIIEYAGKLPSPQCEIFIGTIGGQTARVAPEAIAYSSRDANYVMNIDLRAKGFYLCCFTLLAFGP
jgi:hypothetical protein